MRVNGILTGLLTTGLFVSTASAQLIINPISKPANEKTEAGISAAFSSVDYRFSGGDMNRGVDRMVVGISLSKAVNEDTDICGSAAWLAKTNPEGEGWYSDGGYQLTFGARLHLFERGLGTVTLYGLGHYMSEQYGIYEESYDTFLFEVTGGAIGAYTFNTVLTGYVGAELVAYSDGEFRGADRFDVERDGQVTVRGGTVFDFNKFSVRVELAVGSETAVVVGAGHTF